MSNLNGKIGFALCFIFIVVVIVFTVSQVTAVTKDLYPDGSGNWWHYDQNNAYSASVQASVGKWKAFGGTVVSTFATAYCSDTYSDGIAAWGKYHLTSSTATPPIKANGFTGNISETLADEKKHWFKSFEEVTGVACAILDLEGNNLEDDRDVLTEIIIW